MQENSFPQLRLEDPDHLFVAPPQGIDGAAIRGALKAALAGFADDNTLADGTRLRVLADAGRCLLHNPAHQQEAIHLTETAAPEWKDRPVMVHIRCLALWQPGMQEKVVAEILRLAEVARKNPQLHTVLSEVISHCRLHDLMPEQPPFHHLFWGDLPPDLGSKIASFSDDDGPTRVLSPHMRNNIYQCRRQGPSERDDFERRLAWGIKVNRYVRFITRAARDILRRSAENQPRSAEETQILDLFHQTKDFMILPDLSPLEKLRDKQKNIILVQAHAGMSLFTGLNLETLQMPQTMVSHTTVETADTRNFNIATSGPGAQIRFLKLVKLMKKEARIVRLIADGPAGGDRLDFDLLGRRVLIAQGAATLAYRGQAATFFTTSHWTGSKFRFDLIPGPVASKGISRQDFDAAFYDFYLGCLKDILTGPPEDMAPTGGFWVSFR